jgi:hypothetical protein
MAEMYENFITRGKKVLELGDQGIRYVIYTYKSSRKKYPKWQESKTMRMKKL